VSSRPSGQQLRTPDGRKCWAGNVVRQVGDGWRNADAGACQHWRPGCSDPTDTVVRGCSDTGELLLVNCHLKRTRWGTSSQCSWSCSIWPRPRSNFRVPVITRAAAFNTRCNLSVTVLRPLRRSRWRHSSSDVSDVGTPRRRRRRCRWWSIAQTESSDSARVAEGASAEGAIVAPSLLLSYKTVSQSCVSSWLRRRQRDWRRIVDVIHVCTSFFQRVINRPQLQLLVAGRRWFSIHELIHQSVALRKDSDTPKLGR